MTALTPYDTGARCEAKPWIRHGTEMSEAFPAENFGKVDFEDDEGRTVCTAYVERDPDGRYSVHIEPMGGDDDVRLVLHRSDGFTMVLPNDRHPMRGAPRLPEGDPE